MNVFLTGATGFIGSTLLHELIAAGHNVTALARTKEAADTLRATGANPHTGDLQDLESLRTGASNADAILHTGFIHDFSRFSEVCETDRQAILAMGEVFSGSDRPILVTSGTGLLAPGRLGLESDRQLTGGSPRIATEEAVNVLTEKGVRIAVVRLPPSVHGQGDHGFVPLLINLAREKGVSAYIGEGTNHWSAVHRFDAARLYRL
ncbi:MAG TPA: NAD-dependent epimerase/dehydratase family protein, partial [Flavisolibacter sp.]|nr:NAD-dependent epimerase/dehydratase family protein [Flavisolibacter sp.]